MEVDLMKLNNLIKAFSNETELIDDLLPEINKNIKRMSKLLCRLSLYNIKNNFSTFDMKKSERQKVFHLCNKINYCIRNIINLLLRVKNKYKSNDILDEVFNILIKCFNKSEDVKRIIICLLDKYGFKQRSDNKINNLDTKIIDFSDLDISKILQDESMTENDNALIEEKENKEITKCISNEITNEITNEIDKDVNNLCSEIKKIKNDNAIEQDEEEDILSFDI